MPKFTYNAAASAAAHGRSVFVNEVLNSFVTDSKIPVPDEIKTFILKEVLWPDQQWEEGLAKNQFDPENTAQILHECLELAIRHQGGRSYEEVSRAFHTVIHDQWKCPFPFIFC
jgi:hypothetical protein